MPDLTRGSVLVSDTTTSKFRTGGNDVKSGRATTEISVMRPSNSRSGIASTPMRTAESRDTRARSASSTRQLKRTEERSGSSAIGAPNHARSPRLNSGGLRFMGPPARKLGINEICPAAGAFTVRDAIMRSVSATS